MSLIPSRSSGLSALSQRRHWCTALAATATLAALFAVAPAASAVVVAKTATVGTAQIGGPVGEASISTASPDISEESCTGRGTWVHFYVQGGSRCFGGLGTIIVNFYADEICAGNNYGSFKYTDSNGVRHTQGFSPEFYETFPSTYTINSVTITGWSGSYQCGGLVPVTGARTGASGSTPRV